MPVVFLFALFRLLRAPPSSLGLVRVARRPGTWQAHCPRLDTEFALQIRGRYDLAAACCQKRRRDVLVTGYATRIRLPRNESRASATTAQKNCNIDDSNLRCSPNATAVISHSRVQAILRAILMRAACYSCSDVVEIIDYSFILRDYICSSVLGYTS